MRHATLMKAVAQRESLNTQISALSKKKSALDERILEAMIGDELYSLEDGDFKVTVVAGSRTEYDFGSLKKHLSPAKLKLVTKVVLDVAALSQQVQAGRIPPKVVAACATVKPNKPYLKISPRGD